MADNPAYASSADITPEERIQQEHGMLKFFAYEHLPAHLQEASLPFYDLARRLVLLHPRNTERTVALRKLLEAKDAAVRSLLP